MTERKKETPNKRNQVSIEDQKKIIKWILFGPFLIVNALVKLIPKAKRKMLLGSIAATVILISVISSVFSQTGTSASSKAQTNVPKVSTTLVTNLPTVTLTEFSNFVETNFGGTDWIAFVTGLSNNNGALWIETSLFKDSDAFEPGKNLCVAASMFIISDNAQRFDSLSIRYSSGERMVLRQNFVNDPNSSTCDPEI
jgi:hypothetical protein